MLELDFCNDCDVLWSDDHNYIFLVKEVVSWETFYFILPFVHLLSYSHLVIYSFILSDEEQHVSTPSELTFLTIRW